MKQFISILILLICFIPTYGKKVKLQLNTKDIKTRKTENIYAGSFKVSRDKEDSTYSLTQITFTGFDKKINSSTESFFIQNNTDRTLTGITVTIEYLTPDGRQLEKRTHQIKCNIPAGQTRKTDLRSWDKQHSFYYIKSAPTRSSGSPFTVKFYPEAIYLKY